MYNTLKSIIFLNILLLTLGYFQTYSNSNFNKQTRFPLTYNLQKILPFTIAINNKPLAKRPQQSTLPSCSLAITNYFSDNCMGNNPYTSDWNIAFLVTDNLDNAISYQRNSTSIQTHTLTGTSDTLVFSSIPADGGLYDTLKIWQTNDPTCGDTIIVKRPAPCPATVIGCQLPTGVVSLHIEAEDYSSKFASTGKDTDNWTLEADATASGGQAMRALDSDGTFYGFGECCDGGGTQEGALMNFQTTISTSANYYLHTSAKGIGGNEVYVGLDGALTSGVFHLTSNYEWYTVDLGNIATGLHDINIWERKDGVYIDQLVLSTASSIQDTATLAIATNICDCPIAPTTISGNVFEDYNYDGTRNDSETIGVSGMQVYAYDCNNMLVSTAYTDENGNYEMPGLITGADYRIEFELTSSLACWAQPTQQGADNGTSVQFLQPGNCASLGVANPIDYCNEDPYLVTPCYINGDNTTADDAFVRWSYQNRGTAAGDKIILSTAAQVGSLWGLAYNNQDPTIYTSTVVRRHTGVNEPEGIDAIYTVDPFLNTPNAQTWIELEDDLGLNVGQSLVPTNSARGLGAKTSPSHDSIVYELIGKVGIGDIEISGDGRTLYVMNLFDKTLHAIDIANQNLVGTYPIPDPNCANGTYRPWAIGSYQNRIFVGSICDGSTAGADPTDLTDLTGQSDLSATVHELVGNSFSEVLSFPLDYAKEETSGFFCNQIEGWYPWTDDIPATCEHDGNSDIITYPQPVLSDIEFDDNGDMILGFLDRTALQWGNQNYAPLSSTTNLYSNYSGGDILRACIGGNTWSIESTTGGCVNKAGGALPASEYYGGDRFIDGGGNYAHLEITIGALAMLKGSGEVIANAFDPISGGDFFAYGGPIFLDNETGGYVEGYAVYGNNDFNFGKSAGLGDIELVCAPPPIEIGNYIWLDTDEDGIQSPCESGIADLRVELYSSTGVLLAYDTTDANGQYYFSHADSTDQYWINPGDSLLANTDYYLLIGQGQVNNRQLIIGTDPYILTLDSTNSGIHRYLNDSDATYRDTFSGGLIGLNNYPIINVNTGNYGTVDHSFDAGFIPSIYDWGDLPDTSSGTGIANYQTTAANGGPAHQVIDGLYLGAGVDIDADGQADSNAAGDDAPNGGDDEDGLQFYTSIDIVPGGILNIPFSATNTTGDTAFVEMWIDWNGDGDFMDANEFVVDIHDGNGTTPFPTSLQLAVPNSVIPQQPFGVRIRISQTDNMTPYGIVQSGEVEDYLLQRICKKEVCLPFKFTIKRG